VNDYGKPVTLSREEAEVRAMAWWLALLAGDNAARLRARALTMQELMAGG
jgi:hypothetical protein